MSEKRDLREVLKSELEFLNSGGYRKISWRPLFIFEDSPTCPNFGHSERQQPCSECILMQLVPPEQRGAKVACRYIRLNERGDTIESLYRSGTREELESTLRTWLTREIEKLENAESTGDHKKAKIEMGPGVHS
jgi:hypothetical protein